MKTVLQKLTEKCREAVVSRIPVLYIFTEDMELMHRLVNSDRLVRRVTLDENGTYEYYDDLAHKGRWPYNYVEGFDPVDRRMEKGAECCSIGCEKKNRPSTLAHQKPLCKDWEIPHIMLAHARDLERTDIQQQLYRYIAAYLKAGEYSALKNSVVILYSKNQMVPGFLQDYVEYIDVDLPENDEIEAIVKEMAPPSFLENYPNLKDSFMGFQEAEIKKAMKRILNLPVQDTRTINEKLYTLKEQLVKRNDILKLIRVSANDVESVGGLFRLQEYLRTVADDQLKNASRRKKLFGAETPKGILLCGIPGCGKSLSAKFTAATLGLPLLRLDVGDLMNKYQGESEHNFQSALELAEAMSPCVLFIDELDKAFSGAKSQSGGDNGTFQRIFGKMLSWMQDNQKPCFLFVTANDLSGLPPEFFRSGRFDMLYAMYLPTVEECADILRVTMSGAQKSVKEGRERSVPLFGADCWLKTNLTKLIEEIGVTGDKGQKKVRILTGADISKIVNMALHRLASERMYENVPVNYAVWKQVCKEVAGQVNVYGDSEDNLDSIALTYIRLMKRKFLPSSDRVLIQGYKWNRDSSEDSVMIEPPTNAGLKNSEYDSLVYDEVSGRIKRLVPLIGRSEYEHFVRGSKNP